MGSSYGVWSGWQKPNFPKFVWWETVALEADDLVSSNSACLLAVRLLSPLLSMLWDAIFERESWGRWFPSNYYPNGYFQTCTVWKFHPVSIQQMRGYKLSRTCPPRQQRAVGAFSRPFSRRDHRVGGRRAPQKTVSATLLWWWVNWLNSSVKLPNQSIIQVSILEDYFLCLTLYWVTW